MKIVLTGGGTAGHAMVNSVLAELLTREGGSQALYIGSHRGAERELMEGVPGVTYYPISTGKLRRYLSFENVKDFFRVLRGIGEAYQILKREEVNAVFSGGGYVSLPVVLAARLLGIPSLIRETDLSMGLANRICARFAQKIFTTFPDTIKTLGSLPCEYGGLIVRPQLLRAEPVEAPAGSLPRVLVMGGSLGSQRMNRTVWEGIGQLSMEFQITHLCGRGQLRQDVSVPDYRQLAYSDDMASLYAGADVVVTRCGSNAVSEGLALGKRMVCIPLSTRFSRGEQLANAEYAAENGCAVVLEEKNLSPSSLTEAIQRVLRKPENQSSVLSRDALEENCRRLLGEIHMAATGNLGRRMIRAVKNGRRIDWARLSCWEFQLFAEIAEEYDF